MPQPIAEVVKTPTIANNSSRFMARTSATKGRDPRTKPKVEQPYLTGKDVQTKRDLFLKRLIVDFFSQIFRQAQISGVELGSLRSRGAP